MEIELPDGTIAEFPDNTPQDVIKNALRKRFPAPAQPAPDPAAAQAAQVQSEYDAMPTWQKPFKAADDLVRLAANGMTFGFADKIAGYMGGDGTEAERALTEDARTRAGLAGTVAELGGAVATPAGLAKAGLTATRLPGMIGRYGGLAADGAAVGVADALGNDRDVTTGALTGGALGAAGQAVVGLGSKLISPLRTPPDRAAAAQVLASEGIPVTAGQKTGSKMVRMSESEIGGTVAEDIFDAQREAFTQAALKRVGETSTRATPDVMDNAFSRIGNEFDTLSTRNAMIPDQKVAADLTNIAVDYASTVAPGMRAPIIEKTVDDVVKLLQTGRMDGTVYKTLRSNLDRFARGTMQPEAKMAARDLIQALDTGMERSILRNNPADAGRWSQVRRQYRNMLVLEQSLAGAGENSAMGLISPAKLRQATVNKQGKRAYVRGDGDFADLARAGEALLKDMPDSGTASRNAARAIPNLMAGAIGGGTGYAYGGPDAAIGGALTGIVAPHLALYGLSRGLMSQPFQQYLMNNVANRISPAARQTIARSLAAGGVQGLLGGQ